jgi:multidrug efflux system outer membrane protein
MLAPTARQPLPAHGAPAGIPADLVRNRPDIRAAERRYAAAVARIGVAEAELYPSVQLSGTITAGRIDGVTENSWSFGPSLTFPIFGRKALRANVAAAQADARQALLRWQETVLAAVEQVENSLYAGQKYAAASVSARETVAQYQKSLDLSRRLAAEQSVTSLDLIDIELLISDARETQAQSMRQVALEYVQLNVALGAGYASGAGAPESTASLPRCGNGDGNYGITMALPP